MMKSSTTEEPRTRRIPFENKNSVSSFPLWWRFLLIVIAIGASSSSLDAHSGPPFPIFTDRVVGAYKVSVWTDPDATDDQTAAGRFWVTLEPAADRVVVAIKPLDRVGAERSARAEPVNGDKQRQFVALLMDHEGPFGVHVAIDGVPGKAEVDTMTDATYDLRPRPILTVLFVFPFLLVGFVWGKLLIKRRMHARGTK
jgi:hypothetical protein